MLKMVDSRVTPSGGLDFCVLPELLIDLRDAKREDVGALANIFIKSFRDDKTAQLLHPHDGIWPVVVEMLRTYLDDDYTRVKVAWDERTDAIVGWTSVSLVTSDQDDYFKFYDSTVWAGRELLRRETLTRNGAPLHVDEMRRAGLITQLRARNRDGQDGSVHGQHRLITSNTLHLSPSQHSTKPKIKPWRFYSNLKMSLPISFTGNGLEYKLTAYLDCIDVTNGVEKGPQN